MFNLFKKTPRDANMEEQRQDIVQISSTLKEKTPEIVRATEHKMLTGLDCDSLPDGTGKFGHTRTNPIPVNGTVGEVKYINRLRKDGIGVLFHRVGHVDMGKEKDPIDVYEIVTLDGKHWDIIYFDMYHPRRSLLAPEGYTLVDFNPIYSKLWFGYGHTDYDDNFPFGIPAILARVGSLEEKFGKRLQQSFLDKNEFDRPYEHIQKLSELNLPALQFEVAGESFTKFYFPNLYRIYKNGPDNLERQLRSIADAWHEGSIISAANAFESDLAHQ